MDSARRSTDGGAGDAPQNALSSASQGAVGATPRSSLASRAEAVLQTSSTEVAAATESSRNQSGWIQAARLGGILRTASRPICCTPEPTKS